MVTRDGHSGRVLPHPNPSHPIYSHFPACHAASQTYGPTAHLAVGQDGACWVAEERHVPHAEQAHKHRQVLVQWHVAEVVVNVVGTAQELLHMGTCSNQAM